jgi:hypothetical protein
VVPDSGASSAEDSAPKTADVSTTSPASGKNQNLVSKRERIGTIAGEFDGRFTKTVDIEFTRPHGTSLGFKFGGGTDKPAKPGDPNVYVCKGAHVCPNASDDSRTHNQSLFDVVVL